MATSHESLPSRSRSPGRLTRLPPVRLASREELAAAARVAPLLRVARDLAAWAGPARPVTAAGELTAADAAAAAAALDLSAEETRAAWAVAIGTGMVAVSGNRAGPGTQFDVLTSGAPTTSWTYGARRCRPCSARRTWTGWPPRSTPPPARYGWTRCSRRTRPPSAR